MANKDYYINLLCRRRCCNCGFNLSFSVDVRLGRDRERSVAESGDRCRATVHHPARSTHHAYHRPLPSDAQLQT